MIGAYLNTCFFTTRFTMLARVYMLSKWLICIPFSGKGTIHIWKWLQVKIGIVNNSLVWNLLDVFIKDKHRTAITFFWKRMDDDFLSTNVESRNTSRPVLDDGSVYIQQFSSRFSIEKVRLQCSSQP